MKCWLAVIVAFVIVPVTAQQPADLVIVNANIRTMDAAHPKAKALAITGNKIVAVGTGREIRRFIGPSTKTIDAEGRLVLPGFNDAHVHFAAIGNKFSSIDLREVSSAAELTERLAHYARFLPKGRWIIGGQWNNKNWVSTSLPTRAGIDAVTPDHPVFLYNSDPNTALVNSKALAIAKITNATIDLDAGAIERDASGSPTGVLKGKAVDLVRRFVPADHERDWPAIIQTATNYAVSLGVTSVQDTHSDDLFTIYLDLQRKGTLRTRVYDCVSPSNQRVGTALKADSSAGDYARKGCVKTFSDGDDDWTAELKKIISDAENAGQQIAVHAIGASANRAVADVLEDLMLSNGSRDRRIRIEHAERADAETISKFGRLKVIASVQPFLFADSRPNGQYYKKILESGSLLALGSDAPMTELSPLRSIRAAVVNGGLTVEQAVAAYTVGSAYAEFQETRKGKIAAGMLADIVILSQDIFSIAPGNIAEAKVMTTIFDGKVIYDEKNLLANASPPVSAGPRRSGN